VLTPLRYELQRLRHQQGELLRSRDFRDQGTVEAELRWWHNRALHNAYGVACGLEVQQDGTSIHVAPGLAYDCFGRELLLTHAITLEIPASSAPGTLLVRYRETRGECEPRGRLCSCSSSADAPQHLEFRWLEATMRFDPRDGVPLPMSSPSAVPVIRLRALRRPHVGTGATSPASSAWELWTDSLDGKRLGFQITVDTSAAGFTNTPCYFASLEGPRWELVAADPDENKVVVSDHIVDASATGFTFRLFGVATEDSDDEVLSDFQSFAREKALTVHWLGLQDFACQRS
jgi:hypothetical protein